MAILVVGGTGAVGKQIALQLQQQLGNVRALVRGGDENPKTKELRQAGVEIIAGDLKQAETLDAACKGVDTVITTATSMPTAADDGLRKVDHVGGLALIAAADRAGVAKFVYTSYSGNIRPECPLGGAKRDCEDQLRKTSMQAVTLRPSYFMESWLSPALGFDPVAGRVRIYGTGEAKISYISAVDVAKFAVVAATKKLDRQTTLEIGGPEALSQLDAVRIFENALHKKIALDYVPQAAIEEQHRTAVEPLQKSFAALTLAITQGDEVPGASELAKEYGIDLRSVADYAASITAPAARTA
jgi:NADH dehydrogenase